MDWLTAQGSQKIQQMLAGIRPLASQPEVSSAASTQSEEALAPNSNAAASEPSKPANGKQKRKATETEYEVEEILEHRYNNNEVMYVHHNLAFFD